MSTTDYISKLDQANENYNKLCEELKNIETSESTLLDECRKLEDFFPELESSLNNLCKEKISKILFEQNKLKNIRETLQNNQMQIIFIGNVSCGKSKVVNCILEEEILQSSTGATTNCVVKITSTKEDKNILKYNNKNILYEDRLKLIDKLMDISTTLGDDPVDNNEIICVELTGQREEQLLNDQIQLIDTPGYNISEDVKTTILNQCQIADIVVYVMNYNFNEEEKKLLQHLTTQTSKLNMFVLVNKWDETDNDSEETTEKSKGSITKNVSSWLKKYNDKDAEMAKEKIYFISAKEQMNYMKDKKSSNESRQKEFERFIKGIKNYLSNPKENKYKRHEDEIANTDILKEIRKKIQDEKGDIIKRRKKAIEIIEDINKILNFEKIEIANDLNQEKKTKMANLSGFFNKIVSVVKFVTFSDSSKNDCSIETIVEEYEKRLKKLELSFENDFKKIVDYAFSNKKIEDALLDLEMKNISQYKDNLMVDIGTNQTENEEMATEKIDANKSAEDEFKKNTIHKEMNDTFDEFLKNINDRIDNLQKTTKIIHDNLENTLQDLEVSTEKLKK